MNSYKTTGIVLRRTNYGEADRIITFLTPERGKVSAMAKSVRKVRSRLGGSLELFSVVELLLTKGRELDIVTGARLERHFKNLVTDYERLRRAFLFCEMIDKLTSDSMAAEAYGLLASGLEQLEEGADTFLTELYFKLRLLHILGYRPNLQHCMESNQEIAQGKTYFFSSKHGGLVESRYAQYEHVPIGENHIKLWRLSLKHPLAKVAEVGGAALAARESLPICNDFYDYLFGKRFKAAEI